MALQTAGRLAIVRMVKYHPTKTHGNLRGAAPATIERDCLTCGRARSYGCGHITFNHLPREYWDDYESARYAIHSYSTPIAWWHTSTALWTQPTHTYSRSTSHHQNVVAHATSLTPEALTELEQWLVDRLPSLRGVLRDPVRLSLPQIPPPRPHQPFVNAYVAATLTEIPPVFSHDEPDHKPGELPHNCLACFYSNKETPTT